MTTEDMSVDQEIDLEAAGIAVGGPDKESADFKEGSISPKDSLERSVIALPVGLESKCIYQSGSGVYHVMYCSGHSADGIVFARDER